MSIDGISPFPNDFFPFLLYHFILCYLSYFYFNFSRSYSNTDYSCGSVMEVGLYCDMGLLSIDGKAGWQDGRAFVTWPI